ncbi:MAG: FAD:protein FMN transferase [Nitrosomonas sp.]|nr:FAD:protein FMN transferase [Nitrosomonas sp.]MDP1950637.1 FAD:protein FMN transferase [Nitrosomonas sp.]
MTTLATNRLRFMSMPTQSLTPLRIVIISVAVIVILVFIAAISGRLSAVSPLVFTQLTGNTMGTSYSIKYRHSPDTPPSQTIQDEIEQQFIKINQIMSTYDPESELSRFNHSDLTDWIPVSAPLYTVLKAAFEINRQSKGAFDITLGPLVNLWGFGPEVQPERIPDQVEIALVLKRTGHDKLALHETAPTVRKIRTDVYVDLSGIAKGYAVDQISTTLERHGIEHYMIEIGGEIRARGANAQEIPWQIGIDKPQMYRRSVQKVLSLNNTALATSGNYRNFFKIDHQRYMHVIDPATGWPAKNNLASVSVLADTCMLADAWATALLVLGLEQGMIMAEQLELSALFIVNQDGIFVEHASSHFQPKDTQHITITFLATFLIMGIAIVAMATGIMMGRRPLAGSCGGLGRFGLKCDVGCSKPCSTPSDHKPSADKSEL